MSKTFSTIGFVFKQARPYRWALLLVTLTMLLYVAVDFVHPFVYRKIINMVTEPPAGFQFSALIYLILILLGAVMVHRVLRDVVGFILIKVEINTRKLIAQRVFQRVNKLSYKWHASTFAGSTARKINRGVGRINDVMDILFYDLTPVVLTMIIASGILFKANLLVGLPIIAGLIIFVIISILMVRRSMILDQKENDQETKISGTMIDSITNNLTVKTFTGEGLEDRLFARQYNKWKKITTRAWNWHTWTGLFQGGFIALLEVLALFLALWLWQKGEFTVGDIVFVQANMGLLIFPMWTLGRFYRRFRRAEVDIQDLIKLINKPITIKSPANAPSLKIDRGQIRLNKVCFAYNKRYVLKNINLEIKSGEKIALVGPSGAGKSTFIKLLFRFIDPSNGQILIDNQDIRKINIKSLRNSISLVPQEPLLFHRSIEENIRYGKADAKKEEIIKAAKLARAHEFISGLEKGYKSLVGERGIKLSGGERQRIALARVFLENAPILVLDEATSSLDSVSENLIQEALDKLMKERTTIVIAHRLSTVVKMDRIIVIDKGRIVEQGSHQELIEKPSSLYATLWQSQAGRFLV